MTANFFKKVDELESLLKSGESIEATLRRLRPLLADPDLEREFWRRLEDAAWLPLLRREGFFTAPPTPKAGPHGIRFPVWPPSKYLARVASVSPEIVAEIFRNLHTDNASVIADIFDAALRMPPHTAATLVKTICESTERQKVWIAFEKAGDLCAHLVSGGEPEAALTLTRALFDPSTDGGHDEFRSTDDYWIREGLSRLVPLLAKARPHALLTTLCEWLIAAMEARNGEDLGATSEYSYLWRPAVEEHEQNSDLEFASLMVGFARQGFEEAIASGEISLSEGLEILDSHPYSVFQRIKLHLVGEFAEGNRELARATILNQDLLHDYTLKHEYARLVGRRWQLLSDGERRKWLGWIDVGPDREAFPVADGGEGKENEERRKARREYWKFERLHWIREHLDKEWKRSYSQMLARWGEPELADLNVRVGGVRWGEESPIAVERFTAGSFEDAVELASSWRPSEAQSLGPGSYESLAFTFQRYVSASPEVFSTKAKCLIGRPPALIRRYLDEMAGAVKEGKNIEVYTVLDLCEWVLEASGERPTRAGSPESPVEVPGQETRDEIGRFIESLCRAEREGSLSYPLNGLRERLWRLLAQLCRDPSESYIVRDMASEDVRVHDYLEAGINSPRGRAVQAAFEYSRWVRKNLRELDQESVKEVYGGFAAMPEMREELEWQIAGENSGLEVMSVVGAHTGLIYSLDKEWLGVHSSSIFRLSGVDNDRPHPAGWAAWNAFLVWVGPHVEFYRLLRPQFSYAVSQASEVRIAESTRIQPMYHLGKHLMILYGRGDLGLDDDGGLLRRFVSTANPDVRRYSVSFVGRSIEGDAELPGDVIERFMTLWDLYWSGPGRQDAAEEPEKALFGTWFVCRQFPEQWRLERLREFVEVSPRPEPTHAVAEELAEVAEAAPATAVAILDRLLRADREGWRIPMWRAPATAVLQQAIEGDEESRAGAEALIDHLGRRGYLEFGDLLRES